MKDFTPFFLVVIWKFCLKNAAVFCIPLEDTVQLEAYWDSTYVIPPNRGCGRMAEGLYDAIDLWRDVPKDLAKPGLVINLAYADHDVDRCERPSYCRELVCGLKLYEKQDEDLFADLISSIKEVQDAGGRVKLSVGGFKYGNIKVPTKTTQMAERLVLGISARVRALGVDGVDLVQIEGCGRRNLNCDDQSSIHLYVLARLREELPKGMLLSYTFPVSDFDSPLDFPYVDVVNYGLRYLDSISLMGQRSPYSSNKTIQSLLQRGVPASKIMWGFSKGCAEDVEQIAREVKKMGLRGMTVWSLNTVFNTTTCTRGDQDLQ